MTVDLRTWLVGCAITMVCAVIIGLSFRWYYGHRDRRTSKHSQELRDE